MDDNKDNEDGDHDDYRYGSVQFFNDSECFEGGKI